MLSFRKAYIPQCSGCSTAVTDPDGQDLVVTETLLPQDLRDRLAGGGWTVKVGDAKHGRHDVLLGDSLTCPPCASARAASLEDAARDHAAELARPAVKEIDVSKRLGPGWTLRQREGDAEAKTWLVVQNGEVRGMVRRYRRKTGDRDWSNGWQAYTCWSKGWFQVDATGAAKWNPNSSLLWRSRDLAAWGVATRPAYGTPNPAWASRRAPKS